MEINLAFSHIVFRFDLTEKSQTPAFDVKFFNLWTRPTEPVCSTAFQN